jgi:hypothetical protein
MLTAVLSPADEFGMSSSSASKMQVDTATASADNDRRRRSRMPAATIGYLLPEGANGGFDPSDEPWEVRIHDVSRLGVGFTSASAMKVGEICRVRIGVGPMRLARRVKVVNCQPIANNHFRIGAEFA